MKTAAVVLLTLLLAATASAQTVPTVQQQLYQQQMQLLRELMRPSTSYTVMPSSPYGGTVLDNNTGYMTPYTVTPSPGLRYNLDRRGRIGMSYDLGNGMSIDLD